MDVFIKDDKLLFSKIGQLIGCDPRFNILGGFWGRHRRRPQRGGAEEAQTQCGYTSKKFFHDVFLAVNRWIYDGLISLQAEAILAVDWLAVRAEKVLHWRLGRRGGA